MTFEIQFQCLSLNGRRELGVPFVLYLPLFLPGSVMLSHVVTRTRPAGGLQSNDTSGVTFRLYNCKIVVSYLECASVNRGFCTEKQMLWGFGTCGSELHG